MAIDFTLTFEQKQIQKTARKFAKEVLEPIAKKADREPDTQKAFQMTKPAYVEAYRLGFATGYMPKEYGGLGLSHVDFVIAAEEICMADPGFAATLLVNGLSLMPIYWFGTEAQKRKWIGAATDDPRGEYLAGWTVSEPGGTANYDHPGAAPAGVQVHAEFDAAKNEWELNGTKYWPTNAGGWDLKGADVNVVTARVDKSKGGKEGVGCFIVPRGTPGVRFNQPIDTVAHRLDQNNWVEFEGARIPAENAFAVGDGDLVIAKAFGWSGPVAGIAAVGVARAAYEWTLDWSRNYTGGGDKPIINYQNVGYMLSDVAMKIEAARYMCWKCAHYIDQHHAEAQAFGAMAKIFAGELMHEVVFKCMQIVGVNALDRNNPLEKYARDSMVFPLYDAGNMGMQRRKIWGVMADPDFNPRAFAENEPVAFKKSMGGYGAMSMAGPGAVRR